MKGHRGLVAVVLVLGWAGLASGFVRTTGDVEPVDPNGWDEYTDVTVGRTAYGKLEVTAGDAVVTQGNEIGYYVGAEGEVSISGAGSSWTHDDLNVGNVGTGTLSITGGGQVTTTSSCNLADGTNSSGTVTVSGEGSSWGVNSLRVGEYGEGELTVDAGGSLTSTYSWLGYNGSASGVATVDGEDSLWTAHSYFRVGYFGDGLLTIRNGGEVRSNHTSEIGYVANTDSEVKVTGAGSLWTTVGDVSIGVNNRSLGKLTISDGGAVVAGSGSYCNLAYNDGAGAAVTVSGAGSSWETDNLRVGRSGSGVLKILDGAEVSSDSYGIVGHYGDAVGEVLVEGAESSWTVGGIRVGRYGTGRVEVAAGGLLVSYSGSVGHYADSTGRITVRGVDSAWAIVSEVNIGRYGSGVLKITDGGTVAVMGTMTIDADGGGDSYVKMSNDGVLAVLGDVSASLTSFLGLIGGTDAILYWDDSTGSWANVSGAEVGVDYTLTYETEGQLTGYTLLTVHAGQRYDLEELALLTSYWQMGGCTEPQACAAADLTGDGAVDLLDLNLLAGSWLADELITEAD